METRHYILATAGHVDHGKSSLVKALTQTDPDRLPEEKKRGVTIELGFAALDLDAANSRFRLGIIDVPGHEDFVKNMVAGVGAIDLALIVVAADDGWMPQTEEHLQILTYLGVTRGVVALTKSDLPDAEPELAVELVREELQGTPFAQSPIIPTSAITGEGLHELHEALTGQLRAAPPVADIAKPRLAIDRVFSIKGAGTVVTGTLTGGYLSKGQAVVVQPGNLPSRIRGLQSHNEAVETSPPGTRTAINLADLHPASQHHAGGISRGQVVMLPESANPSQTLHVLVTKSSRLRDSLYAVDRPLKHGTRIQLHLGSAAHPGRIYFPSQQALLPDENLLAELRLESETIALGGDRFIIRDWSEQATLAGGTVLDPCPGPHRFKSEAQAAFLTHLASALADPKAWSLAYIRRNTALMANQVLEQSRVSVEAVTHCLDLLQAEEEIIRLGSQVYDAVPWRHWRAWACEQVDTFHQEQPALTGMSLSQLRAGLPLPSVMVGDLLASLFADGFVQRNERIARKDHRPTLPNELLPLEKQIIDLLARSPLEPPSRTEIEKDEAAKQVLRFLIDTGRAVEVSDELVMNRPAYQQATETICDYLRAKGSATISDLRQTLGTSRRVVMPILDRLDREKITHREGDHRRLFQG